MSSPDPNGVTLYEHRHKLNNPVPVPDGPPHNMPIDFEATRKAGRFVGLDPARAAQVMGANALREDIALWGTAMLHFTGYPLNAALKQFGSMEVIEALNDSDFKGQPLWHIRAQSLRPGEHNGHVKLKEGFPKPGQPLEFEPFNPKPWEGTDDKPRKNK